MSGITPKGNLFTMVGKQAMTGIESARFLKHLRNQVGGMLLVVWDGSPIHRGRKVKGYLADGGTKHIHLEQLPAYAPDVNPAEGVWNQLKFVEMRNLCCWDLTDLHYELNLAIVRLRRKPKLIQSFFAGAGLSL
jgi:transposase